jgi:hypothetical protein
MRLDDLRLRIASSVLEGGFSCPQSSLILDIAIDKT